MHVKTILLSCAVLDGEPMSIVARQGEQILDRQRFREDISNLASAFRRQKQQDYALYHEATYSFAVLLFALWYAGKLVWIPGNNRPATADYLLQHGCRLTGEWHGRGIVPEPVSRKPGIEEALDPENSRLILFTSGSIGEPKAIVKTLLQLQREVAVLERQWGMLLGRSAVAATVSHQHIYGLLFKLLWPLSAGRCIHSPMYLSPEPMLKAVHSTEAYWVASPAQLKRLDELTDWASIGRLTAIFSSGGALSEATARQIEQKSGCQVIEVYGSSETGGIGWRQPVHGSVWTAFEGIALSEQDRVCRLHSPFLPPPGHYPLDDRVELLGDGRFKLLGRRDRIVKVEEKRVSLDSLESALHESDLIGHAHSLLLTGSRDRIAVAIVLSKNGRLLRHDQGMVSVIKQLRKYLMRIFETAAIPRKWLFFDDLPLTPQGKIDNILLLQLLQLDKAKFPQLLYCRWQDGKISLDLRIRPGLVYFDGHFPKQPILPGLAQLAWADYFGKLFFSISGPFKTMEVVKFKKIIQPEALITMTMEWKPATGKLYFELNSATGSHSSGRMVYGVRP